MKETQSEVQKEPTYDLALREEAVAEMRAKAENKSGEKTNVFRNQDGPGKPLSQAEVDARMRALSSVAREQESRLSDDELAAKQQSIRNMRRQAETHYRNRLKKIESQ